MKTKPASKVFTKITGYAVLLKRADGHEWLAYGEHMTTPIYRYRSEALGFRTQLHNHLGKIGRVVKVEETVRVIS